MKDVKQMDYSSKTREELLTICKEKGIKGYSGKKKDDILALLTSQKPIKDHKTNLKFIDLFCGIGGFHQALQSIGAKCVLACDIDEKCRKVYKENYGIEPKEDVTKLKSEEIPDFDILCGGFPCQAFSHAGKQGGFEDTRGTLFRDICRILRDKKPKYFLLENVKNLKGHDKGKTWSTIYKCLTDSGYTTYETPIVISPHQLGIPQHRERVIIFGWRNDVLPEGKLPEIPKLKASTNLSLEKILMDDADIPEGTKLTESEIKVLTLWENFIQYFKKQKIKLPTFPLWSADWDSTYDLKGKLETKKGLELIPEWKQKFIRQNREFYEVHKEFLKGWLDKARKNKSFTGSRAKLEWQAGSFKEGDSIWKLLFQFRPSGIRVKRANYSPALVAMAQIVYVGEKRRKLCPREVARLQSFPDSFTLPSSASVVYKQFGNAVNVDVIKWALKILIGDSTHSE